VICSFKTTSRFFFYRLKYRIWPGFILWGLDRTCRFLRVVILNKLWLSVVPQKHTEMNHVTVERISTDTIRLKLRRHMSWKAGHHVYLILPTISRFPLEAHPFTPASIPHALDGTDGPAEKELTFIIRARRSYRKTFTSCYQARFQTRSVLH
jgi:ferric-chelate reductase